MDGMDGWILTAVHCFLQCSLAHSGLQKGSILWSPCTATKENTMKRNTQNLILYTGRRHPADSHLGRTQLVTLQVWCTARSAVKNTHTNWHQNTVHATLGPYMCFVWRCSWTHGCKWCFNSNCLCNSNWAFWHITIIVACYYKITQSLSD